MHLVETYLTHITSFTVTEVHIADFGKPAIHRTSATGRVEKYILIRQIDTFDISVSFSKVSCLTSRVFKSISYKWKSSSFADFFQEKSRC